MPRGDSPVGESKPRRVGEKALNGLLKAAVRDREQLPYRTGGTGPGGSTCPSGKGAAADVPSPSPEGEGREDLKGHRSASLVLLSEFVALLHVPVLVRQTGPPRGAAAHFAGAEVALLATRAEVVIAHRSRRLRSGGTSEASVRRVVYRPPPRCRAELVRYSSRFGIRRRRTDLPGDFDYEAARGAAAETMGEFAAGVRVANHVLGWRAGRLVGRRGFRCCHAQVGHF